MQCNENSSTSFDHADMSEAFTATPNYGGPALLAND